MQEEDLLMGAALAAGLDSEIDPAKAYALLARNTKGPKTVYRKIKARLVEDLSLLAVMTLQARADASTMPTLDELLNLCSILQWEISVLDLLLTFKEPLPQGMPPPGAPIRAARDVFIQDLLLHINPSQADLEKARLDNGPLLQSDAPMPRTDWDNSVYGTSHWWYTKPAEGYKKGPEDLLDIITTLPTVGPHEYN
jgi:hypothetical protein